MGTALEMNLIDFLHMAILSKQSKLISVTNPNITSLVGLLYIKEGEIVHAEYGRLEGSDALPKILAMKNGFIAEMSWVDPGTKSIKLSFQELLEQYEHKLKLSFYEITSLYSAIINIKDTEVRDTILKIFARYPILFSKKVSFGAMNGLDNVLPTALN